MSRRALWLVLLVAAVAPYFVNLDATSIIDANEAFYTETPREMMEAGTLLNSTFNYEPRFNKPPLSYWLVLGSYRLFGLSLWSARLPIAIGALMMIATAFFLARAAFSTRAAWLAAVTLAATPRFLLFGRRIIIDIYSSMFLGLTLLFFVLADLDPTRRRRWLLAMYVAAALGVLTKGPVAIVIPVMVFLVYFAASGRLGDVRRLMLPTGVLVGAAIVLPYYVTLYLQFGWDHIATFLFRENLARYAEGVGAPNRGPLFYLPVVFADLYFPWSVLLPVSLALVPWRRLAAWRRTGLTGGGREAQAATPEDLRLLLGLWIALTVGFYSLSRAQQDLYVLPVVTAAAALVGGLLDRLMGGTLAGRLAPWTRGSLMMMLAVLAALGAAIAWFLGGAGDPIHLAGATFAGVLLAAGACAALIALWRTRATLAVFVSVASVIAVLWVLVAVALPDFERYKPVPHLARVISALPVSASRVCTFKVAAPSLVFYLRRHVDQLFDDRQLAEFFAANPGASCVMRDNDYDAVLPSLSMPTSILAGAPRFDAQLRDFLNRAALPQLIVVTNSPTP